MLLRLMLIIFIVNIFSLFAESTRISELNETSAFFAIEEQLNDLRKSDTLNYLGHYRTNCAEEMIYTKTGGIYKILNPYYSSEPFQVFCDVETHGGGWTVILSRMDGSVDFYRNWNTYKKGFGDLDGEFFLGLDKIHALTAEKSQELLVIVEDFDGDVRYETYEKFAIGDESESYALHTLGKANGTAGDSLKDHHGLKFSTSDRDSDRDLKRNCAETYSGAWWYNACHASHLTGKYKDNTHGRGINWFHFRGHTYSLKRAIMMIRPRK